MARDSEDFAWDLGIGSKRGRVKQAAQLLAHGDRAAAKGVLMQMYMSELGRLAYSGGPPTMPIHEEDLLAVGVSLVEFKELCDELPGLANPFPKSALEMTKRGFAYCQMKQFNKALSLFNEAIAMDGSFVDAWYSKAGCLCELGRIEDAKDCYRKVLQLNPFDEQAKESLQRLSKTDGENTGSGLKRLFERVRHWVNSLRGE